MDILEELAQTIRQHAEDHHQNDAPIQTPEGRPHEEWAPILKFHQVLHAEEDAVQCDGSLPDVPTQTPEGVGTNPEVSPSAARRSVPVCT